MALNRNVEIKYTQLFINNEFVNSLSGKKFKTINPVNEEVITKVQEGDKADIDRAVAAARNAFKRGSIWRTMDASERGRLLHKLSDLLERDMNYLSSLETLDNGVCFSANVVFISNFIKTMRYNAGYADKMHGNTIPCDGNFVAMTRLEPLGVCGLITPWNAPLGIIIWKASSALAAGNVVVIKPSELSPLTSLYFGSLVKEAGFPAGVVNIVPGYGHTAGAALSQHMNVDMISFTGSVTTGKMIQSAAGLSNCKRVTLELGGKSPFVVFDDANIDEAVYYAHLGVFTFNGQICGAASRLFVQESIYDEFVQKSIAFPSKRVVGDPFDPKSEQGPQIDEKQFNRILDFIESGRKEGAVLRTGGHKIGNKGYYIQPTVFTDVTDDMKIAKEEIFGPVQCIMKFKTMDEVIDRCNATTYGLMAGIFTKDIDKALVFSQSVEVEFINVNTYIALNPQTPFGGYKQSGIGRENGEEGLLEYLQTKSIIIKVSEKSS